MRSREIIRLLIWRQTRISRYTGKHDYEVNMRGKILKREWLEDGTYWFVLPLSRFLYKIGVRANMVSVLGILIHIPVAYLLVRGEARWAAVIGMLAVLDVFDGALARLESDFDSAGFGAFVDPVSDRLSEIILFAGILTYFHLNDDFLFTLLTYFVLAGSYTVSYTRAKAESLGYDCETGLFVRTERYLVMFFCFIFGQMQLAIIILLIGTWLTAVQRILITWHEARKKKDDSET